MIYVSCDGACDGEGLGAWSYVITRSTSAEDFEILAGASGRLDDMTNQRMEILAAVFGLEAAARFFPDEAVTLVSDSAYVINCFHERWFIRWLQDGWLNSKGEPVKNQDDWQLLFDVVGFLNSRREPVDLILHPVEWQHVKGHVGHPTNEWCDRMCREVYRWES